ncbi:MAG: type I-U CRISPR-associated protein Csb2, partial [Myxococcota bacterium]
MLALRIEYLTGRCTATAFNDRGAAEWPPHPARIYSALAATFFETDGDADEREALAWLAAQDPPSIAASAASARDVVPVFVPVNDTTVLTGIDGALARVVEAEEALALAAADGPKATAKAEKALAKAHDQHRDRCLAAVAPGKVTSDGKKFALGHLPERRNRQPRTFPSVTPVEPVVHVVWPVSPPDAHRAALRRLARRVSRIGHSSSLVACDVVDDAPAPTWVPDPTGERVLRTVQGGQLERLDRAFEHHVGVEPRVLPSVFSRYAPPAGSRRPEPPGSVFGDDWVVLARSAGPRLPIGRAVDLASAVRGALLRHAAQPAQEVLTGHPAPGVPSERPHVAIVPLPVVGNPHADGVLVGVAVVIPRAADAADRAHVYDALARWAGADERFAVHLGRAGELTLKLADERRLQAHEPGTWCGPATVWASATPVALDRNPGDLLAADPTARHEAHRRAEAIVAASVERIGLPAPAEVEV